MTNETLSPNREPADETPLEGWKDIANYLKRGVRTVKRWEKNESLPVRRHQHQARSSVYAYPSELDAWLATRQPVAEQPGLWFRRPVSALAMTTALFLSLVSVGNGRILTPGAALASDQMAGMVFRQIDFDALGRTPFARLSPDGEKMLYVHVQDERPRFSIRVMDLASGKDQPLVEGVGGTNVFEWAPDGQKVVYMYRRRELRVISFKGGEPEVLWSSPDPQTTVFPLDWSRDGGHILAGLITRAEWKIRLAILPAAGGEPRYVVSGKIGELGEHARFSPDGHFIVGMRRKGDNTDLYVWAADGSQEIRVTTHPAKDDYPFWSPDGNYIVFTSDRNKTEDLWAIPTQEATPTGTPLRIRRNLGKNTRLTGFTSGGQLTLLVVGNGTIPDLFVLPVDPSTGEAPGAFVPFAKYPMGHFHPRWSPDGKRVAYTSRKGNIGWPRIFISSGSSEEDQEVPVRDYYVVNLEWSRDGQFLLFPGWQSAGRVGLFRISLADHRIEPLHLADRLGPGGQGAFVNLRWLPQAGMFMLAKFVGAEGMEVYTLDPEGKNLQLVGKIPTMFWTWPSPDGRYVAYREEQKLKLISLAENTSTTLAESPPGEEVEGPAWSPDGRLVAWKDKQELKVLSLPEGTSRVLVEAQEKSEIGGMAWFGGLAWSPDGQWIAYVLRDTSLDSGNPAELWIVPAAGGPPRKIAVAPASHPVLGELTWHPNGEMIAATGQIPRARTNLYEHWVLENFLPEVEVAQKEE